MEEQSDKVFIRNFSLIVVVLVLFTFTIFFLARSIGSKEKAHIPSRAGLTEERIRPVADVYTEENNAAVPQEAVVQGAEAETAPAQIAASAGSVDGEKIYNSVCAACHATGLLGAPIPGSAEMAQRAEKGMDALVQNAVNGLNAMPPRGGRPDLSDEQLRAVIKFMLK